MKRKILSLLTVLILCLSMLPMTSFAASTESEVKAKIEAMARGEYGAIFKVGNYWNQMVTSPCTSDGNYGHKNKDPNPDTDKWYTAKINGSTREGCQCYGFAHAVFDELFGGGDGNNILCETIKYSSGSKKEWIIKNAKVGDLINIKDGDDINGHWGIFYKYDSSYLYFYDANGYTNAGTCKISLTDKRPWGTLKLKDGTPATIYRAKNYNISAESEKVEDYYLLTSPDGVQTMRSSDSTSASKIIDIPAQTIVCVTKYNSDGKWGYVTYNGKSGWIRLYYVEKHTHSYGSWTTTKAATCTVAGTKKQTCACGLYKTATIATLGHNYSTSWTTDKAATCTAAGSKSHHCTRCSAKTDVTAIAAKGHSFGAWKTTKNATCLATGQQTRTCSACSSSESKTISANGHTYSSLWTTDKAATCTTAGSKSHHCTVCGSKTDITTVAATAHSFGEWKTTKEPTTSATGQAQRSCTRNGCSETETKTIAKLASDGHTHKYGEWKTVIEATCTNDGKSERKCTVCKESETAAISHTGHSFGQWKVTLEPTQSAEGKKQRSCANCSETETQSVDKLPQIVVEENVTQDAVNVSSDTVSEEIVQNDEPGQEQQSGVSSQMQNDAVIKGSPLLIIVVAAVLGVLLIGAIVLLIIFIVKKK